MLRTYDSSWCGRFPLMRFHDLPKSVVLKMNGSRLSTRCRSMLTYAVPASKLDGAMLVVVPSGGKPVMFLVTLVQLPAPSLVSHTCPSLVPAQMRPFWIFDGA